MPSRAKPVAEVNVTYVGPALVGKTSNLRYLSGQCKPHQKLKSGVDRNGVQLFQYAPGAVAHKGVARQKVQLRFNIVTVGGSDPRKEEARRASMRVADAIVFVADSRAPRQAANADALRALAEELGRRGLTLTSLPMVIQYNWRDAPPDSLLSVEELQRTLNAHGAPHVEAVATRGTGVFETFQALSKQVITRLEDAWKFVLV